jgi:hypothetical protein
MFCSRCGDNVAEGSVACSRCGAPVASAASQPNIPGSTRTSGFAKNTRGAQAYNFDAKRWTRSDQIVGIGSAVLLIALFLPWFSVNVALVGSVTASGTTAHGWLWIVFILTLVVFAYLILTAGYAALPFNLPLPAERILLSVTGFNLMLVLIAFLDKPSIIDMKIGWDFGAFIGLIAAIAAVVPLVQAVRPWR